MPVLFLCSLAADFEALASVAFISSLASAVRLVKCLADQTQAQQTQHILRHQRAHHCKKKVYTPSVGRLRTIKAWKRYIKNPPAPAPSQLNLQLGVQALLDQNSSRSHSHEVDQHQHRHLPSHSDPLEPRKYEEARQVEAPSALCPRNHGICVWNGFSSGSLFDNAFFICQHHIRSNAKNR